MDQRRCSPGSERARWPARFLPLLFLFGCAAVATAQRAAAQTPCYDLGSVWRPAAWEASPALLGCAQAPNWPAWHLFTPPHREPMPMPGYNPGNATALPRMIVRYACTGLLLVPVVPVQVRTMGYVIDQPRLACAAGPAP